MIKKFHNFSRISRFSSIVTILPWVSLWRSSGSMGIVFYLSEENKIKIKNAGNRQPRNNYYPKKEVVDAPKTETFLRPFHS